MLLLCSSHHTHKQTLSLASLSPFFILFLDLLSLVLRMESYAAEK